MRICSFVPGATEVVAALGLETHLVGISHECDYPTSLSKVPVLVRPRVQSDRLSSAQIDAQVGSLLSAGTGIYELDEHQLRAARPDVIIAQDLCDVCAITPTQLNHLLDRLTPPPRMVTLNPRRLEDVLEDIETLGIALERKENARELVAGLRRRLDAVRARRASRTGLKVACLEWLSPLYTAGHWVPDMIEAAGGMDVLTVAGSVSQKVDWDTLCQAAPDVVILMPCGFTTERTRAELSTVTEHPQWRDLAAVQTGSVFLVDALAFFSRPGPRLIDGVEQLAAIFRATGSDEQLPTSVERLERPATLPR